MILIVVTVAVLATMMLSIGHFPMAIIGYLLAAVGTQLIPEN
jgi:hypothetical protein